jgi:hypothetical protein|tara:strand:- start:287 stop:484 length:198 start_codon:yes stop_codon:yes gene_type:complete
LHSEIWYLLYLGQGQFTFDQVYTLPIYLRRFYIKKYEEQNKKEKEYMDKQTKKTQGISKPGITRK